MKTCEKCGAYIPIDETACPACGYDPEEEKRRAAEQERRKAAAARRKAAEEKRRKAEEEKRRAEEEARKQQSYTGGAQYAYAPRPEQQSWTPPWEQQQTAYRPQAPRPEQYWAPEAEGRQAKNKWVAAALCLFMGPAGVHKFYEGKVGAGLLYLFTGGLFGVGWLIDLVHLLSLPEETYYVD